MNLNSVTKHLSSLSLDSQKKITASPEFVPGRGLTGSNSSSPNLFNNSYTHSQENVGGTTYFYLGNATSDAVTGDDGTDAVSLSTSIFLSLNNNKNNIYSCIYLSFPSLIFLIRLDRWERGKLATFIRVHPRTYNP